VLGSLDSLSFAPGLAVVVVLSCFLAPMWAALTHVVLRWVSMLLAPLIVSSSLYWIPVWFGAGSVEFRLWAFGVIAFWYLCALVVSVPVALLIRRDRKNKRYVRSGG